MYINQAPAGTFTWSGTGYLKQGVSLPVITYYLYRDSLSNGNWVPIDSISGTQNKMSDAAYQANPGGYDFARWRVEALLSDSVNTGCTLPDLRPVHGMNNTTTRSNTQHNSIFTSASTLATALPSISVFPNPTNGIFQLKITNYESGIRNVDILNILGQKVYSVENYQITKSSNYQIDLSNQPAGVYFVKVLTDKSVQVVKLIKE